MSWNVPATARFRGGPGREAEAAEAWAWELKYYFRRRVGEQPVVTYQDGVYTVTGLMTTSHPFDSREHVYFDKDAPPWDLDFGRDTERRERLMKLYRGPEFG